MHSSKTQDSSIFPQVLAKNKRAPLLQIYEQIHPRAAQLTSHAKNLLLQPFRAQMFAEYEARMKQNLALIEEERKIEEERFLRLKNKENKENSSIHEKIRGLMPEIIKDYIDLGDYQDNLWEQGQADNVSEFIALREYALEYRGNESIRNAVYELAKAKPLYRKIRGDGNCFFRAAAIQYFEKILEENIKMDKKFGKHLKSSKIMEFLTKVLNGKLIVCKTERKDMEIDNYLNNIEEMEKVLRRTVSQIIYQKFFLIEKLQDERKAYKELLNYVQQKINKVRSFDIALIVFLRSYILKKMEENWEFYKNFIFDNEAGIILKTYGLEAENIIIPVASDAMQSTVVVNILHTDYKINKTTLLTQEYKPQNEKNEFLLNMFFRPGHYEMLYDREFYEKYFKDEQNLANL